MNKISFNGHIHQKGLTLNADNLKLAKRIAYNKTQVVEDTGKKLKFGEFDTSIANYNQVLQKAKKLPYSGENNTIDLKTGEILTSLAPIIDNSEDIYIDNEKAIIRTNPDKESICTRGFADVNCEGFDGSIWAKKGIRQTNPNASIGENLETGDSIYTQGDAYLRAKEIEGGIKVGNLLEYDNKEGSIDTLIRAKNAKINVKYATKLLIEDTAVVKAKRAGHIAAKNDIFIIGDVKPTGNYLRLNSENGTNYFVGVDELPENVLIYNDKNNFKLISEEEFEQMKKTHPALKEIYKDEK